MRHSPQQTVGSVAAYALSAREVAFVAFVLVVPIPLFALSGLNVPLPAVVERVAGSLVFGGDDRRPDPLSRGSIRRARGEAPLAGAAELGSALSRPAAAAQVGARSVGATSQRRAQRERISSPAAGQAFSTPARPAAPAEGADDGTRGSGPSGGGSPGSGSSGSGPSGGESSGSGSSGTTISASGGSSGASVHVDVSPGPSASSGSSVSSGGGGGSAETTVSAGASVGGTSVEVDVAVPIGPGTG
jgi:hypothetical protein